MKQKIAVVVATILTIGINISANIVPFNNKSTAQISDSLATYFVPAGYVFAIWGLIYLAILAFAYYQLKFADTANEKVMAEISEWYLISCMANSVWIFLWHYEFFVATIFMMILLLVSLIAIFLEIKKFKKVDRKLFWMVKAPFSLYLGWICVATIANVSGVLFSLGIDGGMNAMYWGAGMMLVAAVLGLLFVIRERDFIVPSVIIWALIGIEVKFAMVPVMVIGAVGGILLLIFGSILSEIYKKYKKS